MSANGKRVHIMLYEINEADIKAINTHIRKNGASGGLSEAIRFALRKTSDAIENRSL